LLSTQVASCFTETLKADMPEMGEFKKPAAEPDEDDKDGSVKTITTADDLPTIILDSGEQLDFDTRVCVICGDLATEETQRAVSTALHRWSVESIDLFHGDVPFCRLKDTEGNLFEWDTIKTT
jgi:hypothetical protein